MAAWNRAVVSVAGIEDGLDHAAVADPEIIDFVQDHGWAFALDCAVKDGACDVVGLPGIRSQPFDDRESGGLAAAAHGRFEDQSRSDGETVEDVGVENPKGNRDVVVFGRKVQVGCQGKVDQFKGPAGSGSGSGSGAPVQGSHESPSSFG